MRILPKYNPNSPSAVRKRQMREAITVGTCTCEKCGATNKTLYKVSEDPATYICADCRKVDK